MSIEHIYLLRVNKTLERLRRRCLGQDTLMLGILPQTDCSLSPEDQAVQITEIFLFALLKVSAPKAPNLREITECRIWLYHAILRILQTEEPEDCTFSALKAFFDLPGYVRKLYFEGTAYHGIAKVYEREPPILLNNFNLALLCILRGRNMQSSKDSILEKLEQLLDIT